MENQIIVSSEREEAGQTLSTKLQVLFFLQKLSTVIFWYYYPNFDIIFLTNLFVVDNNLGSLKSGHITPLVGHNKFIPSTRDDTSKG